MRATHTHLKQALPDRDVLLIFLDATQPLRFARALSRGRENVSQEGFLERDIAEEGMGLAKVRKAGAVVLENTLTKEVLYDQFRRQFGMLLAQKGYSDDIRSHEQARELENTILMALHEADPNKSYTTTEIARLVNARFGPAKSKNNISRYFNQDFHPYFEVTVEESKTKYRLSNTGHSEALRLLRASNLYSSGRQAPRKPIIQPDFFTA